MHVGIVNAVLKTLKKDAFFKRIVKQEDNFTAWLD